ncbi:flippase [Chloroflexota bacterium]
MVTENLKRYIRNLSWLVVAELAARGASFVAIILIARSLGKEQLGIYSFVMSLVFIFAALADLGISPIAIRELSRNKKKVSTYLSCGITLKLFLGIIACTLILLTGKISGKSDDVLVLLTMASIWMIADSLSIFLGSIFQAFEDMRYVAFIRIIEKSTLLMALGAVFIIGLTLKIVLAVYLLSGLLGLCIAIYIAWRRYNRFVLAVDLGFSKKLLKESFFLGLSSFAFLIYNRIDIVMLSLIKDDEAAGIYSAYYNLFLLAGLVPILATAAVFPSFSNLYITAREKLRQDYVKGLKILLILAILLVVPIVIAGNWLLDILYGSEYVEAVTGLRILILTALFSFPAHLLSRLLIIAGRQKWVFWITAIAALLNIVLNIILIPFFGYIGASIAMVITGIFDVTISFLIVRRVFI